MVKKLFSFLILPIAIVGLCYLIVESVMQPVRFNKEKAHRESVAIERLKDIRTLEVAFKSETGHYTDDIDSLKAFYNDGKIKVVMQIGSQDDSAAVANTQAIRKRKPKIKDAEIYSQYYLKGEKVVCKIEHQIPVRDTLFNHREGFCIDSLAFIPFCGDSLILEAALKQVSGVKVPLFEASMPYKLLLKGMDHQLIVNLVAERDDTGRYPGLKVGSITAPNNNAGNWE